MSYDLFYSFDLRRRSRHRVYLSNKITAVGIIILYFRFGLHVYDPRGRKSHGINLIVEKIKTKCRFQRYDCHYNVSR